ncbi:MAG: hypothetical protein KGD64_06310 [Candidatus Heimdallarchaeota archaeon]|nr:hypothetical protein [Candidatus Heimdallarchaeota archaeon]
MSNKNIHTFVSTEFLSDYMVDERYKILDLRSRDKFDQGHIAGSVHINSEIFLKRNDEGASVIPDKSKILNTLREKGVNNEHILILVDDVFNLNCSNAAWIFHYFGFFNIQLLDGALSKWEKENRSLTTEETFYPLGNIDFTVENPSIYITKDEILMNIYTDDHTFVDNRSDYAVQYDQQGGIIPGAKHFWYLDVFEEFPDFFVLKDLEIIHGMFIDKGIIKKNSIILYCESAPQSALVYLVMKELGYPDVKLYLAGYEEWRIICSFL